MCTSETKTSEPPQGSAYSASTLAASLQNSQNGDSQLACLSPARKCEYGFLNLCLGEILGLLQIDVREVGQFISRNHAAHNGRAFGLKRLIDGLAQLARLFRRET